MKNYNKLELSLLQLRILKRKKIFSKLLMMNINTIL